MKKSISLFSGIGGLDEGVHRAGITPLFCCELDSNAYSTLENWCKARGVAPELAKDINEINPTKLKRDLGLKSGELDLLFGGPPCQSFSIIGKRGSLEDSRGLLLYKMIEFATVFKPKVILIEQVKGLLSAKNNDIEGGLVIFDVISKFQALGYTTTYKVLRAADFGVPQLRDRVFVVASKGKTAFKFPMPTHYDPYKKSTQLDMFQAMTPYVTLKQAIGDLPKPVAKGKKEKIPSHLDITPDRDRERMADVPEGECLAKQLHLPADIRKGLTTKDTTKFRRMAWDQPSLTLRGGEAFYHPTENRYLTPREYLRIHGFPDDHILSGPIRGRSGTVKTLDQHRLVANAVPPPLAEAVTKEIVKQFLS
jgi:DNA (cytosine-5)-methyltransferase 1